ncbi:hypothetical protein ACFQZE_07285 [Paenibacillus sp. GCM10027627]|uniref:hypothetical protein n=1 Tax=unclassified Paenibacillus TaxID=185978 RepID=UPI00363709D9
MNELSKPVYIPSIEGCDIYNHMFRGREIDIKYIGMIPSSLELNKLVSIGLKTKTKKTNNKMLSDDIINVKFKQKVNSGIDIITKLTEKILKLDDNKSTYAQKLNDLIDLIKFESNEAKWNEVTTEQLRKQLYADGFYLNGSHYVVYKRSSAKSRIGQCLFIKKKFHKPMIKWSRMNIDFNNRPKEDGIDFPSLLAYESLVGSSIESIITIDPKNILMVDDVHSTFTRRANVIKTDENGYLNSFKENAQIKNNLFDGEALLDTSYFTGDKSMMLLRNHMFKSAAFNCNIQKFLKDHCPQGIDFDEWKIPTMFKNEFIYAKDVHLITTPSSLKALKFSTILGSDLKMWRYWKKLIQQDGCKFGVCKSEKRSKLGVDDNGNSLQQTSYQMLNSLPMNKKDIENFTKLEKKFIIKLKNDNNFFIEYIKTNANDINCNEMFAELYNVCPRIVHTKVFRKFRKDIISSHVTHIKNGKVRLRGDYCVMLGNPIEFLYHAIGKLDRDNPISLSLIGNEVHTSLFNETELTGFRNPHTSPNNVLLVKNINSKIINTYFNLSENIVCVNAIDFPLQDILSGADYDSDTVLLTDDNHLLSITKKVFGRYDVCINQVKNSKRDYIVCNEDMAIIDSELSNSQKYIGRTVNIGQLCMSRYWDLIHSGHAIEDLDDLMKKIDVVTVLSGICIDLAKKMFDININKEIDFISKTKLLKKNKPLFWRYVSQNEKILTGKYNCPMDLLYLEMENIKSADHRKDVPLKDLLMPFGSKGSAYEQEQKILLYVEAMVNKINSTYANNALSTNEKERRIDDAIKYCSYFIKKLKINSETMYSLLSKISSTSSQKNRQVKLGARLMGILYNSQKHTFLTAFSLIY